jgi:stage II sporulation protein D
MKFKFSLEPVLNYRKILERNAEIALGKEIQKLVKLESELLNLFDEYKNLVVDRGGVNTRSAERFMDFVSYAQRLKELIVSKKLEIASQNKNIEKAKNELVKKTQEKKAIEVVRDSQKAAFKLAEKRAEAKQTDEAAGNMFFKLLSVFAFVFTFFACAPLRPIGPHSEFPIPPDKTESEIPVYKDYDKRYIISVGVAFEKDSATIECPNKKWEFKAKTELGRHEIQADGDCIYAGKAYRGNWAVLSTDSGIAVINSLHIEDYLKGVVPHEIGKLKQSELEALKAQAVAARTYAYHHLNFRKSQGFDVYADTRDQVYNGKSDEDSITNKAILATSGLVIKHNGNLIEAYYHSTCSGKTDSPEVWDSESKPYLVSVSDSANGKFFCEASKYRNWEEKFTKAELGDLFQKNIANAKADKIFSFSKVEQIFIIEKFPSGRVKRLVVFTDKGSFEIFGDRTRWLFQRGGKILPSALFSISREKDNFIINGSGFGHGIGMCQIGVIARAREGQKFEDILKAYYTNVSIEEY